MIIIFIITEKSKKSEKYQYVRGTHLHQAEDYREKDGMFQCIITKVQYSVLKLHGPVIPEQLKGAHFIITQLNC